MSDTILETDGLTREFGGFVAVDGVSLRVETGHDPRPDRPERRRQDHLLQPADRVPAADPRHDPVQGPRHHRHEAGHGRPARPGPQLPDLRRIPASDGAGERAPGAAARARRQLRLLALGNGAEGLRRPRPRVAVRCRPVRLRRHRGRRPALRPEARAGDRHHAGARPRDDAAGRTHRRHGARRRGPHRRADQAHPRRPHHPDGGAQSVGRRRPVRHHHRADPRPGAGRGRLRHGVEESRSDRRLSGNADA